MTTAYFLTGSYKGQDNDFEIKIDIAADSNTAPTNNYAVSLTDLSDGGSPLWSTAKPVFCACLDEMEAFLSDNFITLYSKILTSSQRDPAVDKQLEGFILNLLEF